MRQLAIDMGNTRVKVGVFSGEKLIKVLEEIEPEAIPNLVHQEEIERVIISSVVADFSDIREQIDLKDVIRLTPELDIPIKNCYGTPATLGMDRLAGVIGANHLHQHTDCLVGVDYAACFAS